jgi:L-serine dehydratase
MNQKNWKNMKKGKEKYVSIFNDVMGPVMRGPSSSHTAGSYHIGKMIRSLMNQDIRSVVFTFDPNGSYGRVYRQQGVDLAFAVGVMGWDLTDQRFFDSLQIAADQGKDIQFKIAPLNNPDHPNTVHIKAISSQEHQLTAVAKSVGGGVILLTQLDGWEVELTGKAYETVVIYQEAVEQEIQGLLGPWDHIITEPSIHEQRGQKVMVLQKKGPLTPENQDKIFQIPGVTDIWTVDPVYYVKKGDALFSSATEILSEAKNETLTLGQLALNYEAQLLGITKEDAVKEMLRRYEIIKTSVSVGLSDHNSRMQLLDPTANGIMEAEAKGKLAMGGLHTRAAARAMAAMHTNNSMGIVCAAPTGGSAGVIPGVMVTLEEEKNLTSDQLALALFAASAIGIIVAIRATFAAEVAGCQVEIGVAGAMAAAAVVEVAGGTAHQALDAAAISLQNSMGSICDLVQGMCEIPCHTRNATAASSAFVCADLILGGYVNPIPLDETVDAMYSVGKMLPSELRCTALGGLAMAPSARKIPNKRN